VDRGVPRGRLPLRLEVLVIGGERRVLNLLEVDRLEPLTIDSGEEVEVVRVDGAVAQLLHPVTLELVEPAETEIRVDQAPLQAEGDERAEPVQTEPAHDGAEGTEPLSATGGGDWPTEALRPAVSRGTAGQAETHRRDSCCVTVSCDSRGCQDIEGAFLAFG